MAFGAIDFQVFSCQWVICDRMIEEIHILKGEETGFLVTFCTIGSILAVVLVVMAAYTAAFFYRQFTLENL